MKTVLKGFAFLLALAGSADALAAPQYGRDDYGYSGQRFRCESDDKRQRYCRMDTRGGVEMVRQLSSAPCVRGRNWDYDRNGVWVSHGCRAEFVAGYGGDGYYGGGNGYGRTIRCESSGNRTKQCNAETRGGVRLVRQLSSSPCIEGRSWGYSRNMVWVSNGCRAEFRTGAGGGSQWGGGYPGNDYPGSGYGNTLRCESDDNRQRRCSASVRGSVELVRQLSSTRCVEGSSGVWVDRGCRGEFRIR